MLWNSIFLSHTGAFTAFATVYISFFPAAVVSLFIYYYPDRALSDWSVTLCCLSFRTNLW